MLAIDQKTFWMFVFYSVSAATFAGFAGTLLLGAYERIPANSDESHSSFSLTLLVSWSYSVALSCIASVFVLFFAGDALIYINYAIHYATLVWHLIIAFYLSSSLLNLFPKQLCLIGIYWAMINVAMGVVNPLNYMNSSVDLVDNDYRISLTEDKRNSMLAALDQTSIWMAIPIEFPS